MRAVAPKPVNVVFGPRSGPVPLSVLEAAGVKRVSLGGALYRQAMGSLVTAARRLKAGDFDIMGASPTTAEITALLPR